VRRNVTRLTHLGPGKARIITYPKGLVYRVPVKYIRAVFETQMCARAQLRHS